MFDPLVSARHFKPQMAVLAGPTRSFAGWAYVKLTKLSRPVRRFVLLRSCVLSICTTDNPRSAMLSFPTTSATMSVTPARCECVVRTPAHRVVIIWPSDADLRVCKAAFEFSNRKVDDCYKLVTHRQLGKGRNSEVVFAFDTATGDHAAVKVINKDKARHTDREFAENEVCMRMTIQHPCIVQTLDIFESPFDLFVIMELMAAGALDRRLVKQGVPLDEAEARAIMRRLFAALSHLHARGIVHRNVKPQNVFLDVADDVAWACTAKLSDFSMACVAGDGASGRQVVGTPEFLAPEAATMVRTEDGQRAVVFGTEIDMWAAGVTLYNLLSLRLPFEGEMPSDVLKKVRAGHVSFDEGFEDVSNEARSLIRALLNVDRRKRPTADTVMLHPWFARNEHEVYDSEFIPLGAMADLAVGNGRTAMRAAAIAVVALVRLWRRVNGGTLRRARRSVVVQVAKGVSRVTDDSVEDTDGADLSPGAATGKAGANAKVRKQFDFNVSGIDIAPSSVVGIYEEDDDDEAMRWAAVCVRDSGVSGDRSDDGDYIVVSSTAGGPESASGGSGRASTRRYCASKTIFSRVSNDSTLKSRSSGGTDSVGTPLSIGGIVGGGGAALAPPAGGFRAGMRSGSRRGARGRAMGVIADGAEHDSAPAPGDVASWMWRRGSDR